MNDNIANITTLINNQIVMMNTYNTNVSQSMQYISNSIRELIHLQEARDMEERVTRRRRNNIPIASTSNFMDSNINRINRNISRLNRDIRTLDSRDNNRTVGFNRNIDRNRTVDFNTNENTRQPFIFSTSRLPSARRTRPSRPLRNTTQPYMNPLFNRRRRRRMTLQEFINSTVGQGNPRIPADRNQIMQQTSIVDFQDLSGTDIHTCPISLTTFDASSNILRINECNHIFLSDSLMRWFQEDSRCPVCRYNINRDLSNQTVIVPRRRRDRNTTRTTNTQQESNMGHEDNEENINDDEMNESSNISPNTIVYDISFSIPQLFGRDMSENQINEVIESITNTITNSMNNSLSNFNETIEDGDVVVEEMIIERVDDTNNSAYGDMESDSDEN
jgi:hypothetical protein